MSFLRANPGTDVLHVRDVIAQAMARAAFHERFGISCGWRHGAVLAFWSKHRLDGVLLLHRGEREPDFTESEMGSLRLLHPHFEVGLRRVIAHRQEQAMVSALGMALRPIPVPLVFYDWDLNFLHENPAGAAMRAAWSSGSKAARTMKNTRRAPLPADLATACRRLKAEWEEARLGNGRRRERPSQVVEHSKHPGWTASLSLIEPNAFPLVKPMFSLRFEGGAPILGMTLPRSKEALELQLARLTPREVELAALVCAGCSNKEIAARLHKGVPTVKAQLHSIFRKLQVPSRSMLMAVLK